VASYEMSDFNYKRQTAKDDNVGRPTMDVVHVVCQLTTTSQTQTKAVETTTTS